METVGTLRIIPPQLTAAAHRLKALARGPLHQTCRSLQADLRELQAVWSGPAQTAFDAAFPEAISRWLSNAADDLDRQADYLIAAAQAYTSLERRLIGGEPTGSRSPGKPPGLARPRREEPPVEDNAGHLYVIVPGDTLWWIAVRHGTTVEALRAANGIEGHLIFPGQKLVIPAAAAETPHPIPALASGTVVVRSGDTLWGLALAHGTTVAALRQANGIVGDLIFPDQVLRLTPGSTAPPSPSAPPSPDLSAGAPELLPEPYLSGYGWLSHTGHYAVDLNTQSTDKTLRAPYAGTRIVADPCPACTADGSITGQLPAGTTFAPENNWGYGAVAIVETRAEDLTIEQRSDLAERGVAVEAGQSLYILTAHLQPDTVTGAGAALEAGDPIATLGTSGNSTGPHVHVEVAVAPEGLRPAEGQNSASFWIGTIVGVRNGAAAQGTRVDPTPVFVAAP